MNSTRTLLSLVTLALLAACGGGMEPPADAADAGAAPMETAATGEGGIYDVVPAPLPMERVSFPAVHERTLSNGARVIIVENHEQPVASINLRIGSGSAADPRDRTGIASFTASLLNKGTETRTGDEIAQTIDYVGGQLGASAGTDWTSVTATVLTEFLDTALVLLEDIVQHPTFPEEELEIERRRTLSGLQVELSQPQALAQRRFTEEVYGRHPYGKLLTPQAVEAITRQDLLDFHRRHFRASNALFVVAGAVDPDDIVDRLERRFGDWRGGQPPSIFMAAPPEQDRRRVVLVHKPGSVQAVARLGHLMQPATDPDWDALDVMLRILGGGSTGWLFEVLREEKGYTYGAYAQAAKRVDRGYFQAWAEVRNEVADSALTELIRLLDRIRGEPVPEEDLRLAKDNMIGSFPLRIETPGQVAGQVATTRLLGLPDDHLETYRDRIAAVTAADVRRVAERHLHPDRSVLVVVGDGNELYEKLQPFGAIEMYDVEGEPLTLADLEIRASDVAFDPSVLEARTLVYSLVVQGNAVGEITTVVSRGRVDGRDAYRVQTSGGGPGFTMRAEVAFDAADFTPIRSNSEQTAGPNRMATELSYERGRVVGTIEMPGRDEEQVDVAVVPGTILPGMDEMAVWLTDFEEHEELELPAVNAQSGTQNTIRLRRSGTQTVTVPAGEFEVYVIDVSGGETRSRLYARKDAPHFVVKQEISGQPVTIELTEIR